jgi:hypothetical protein
LFEEIMGIPAHPLIVHAAVVFVPLQVAAAIAYAVVPAVRRRTGWLVIALAIVGPATAWVAKLSGEALQERMAGQGVTEFSQIDQHSEFANMAWYVSMALGVLMILMVLVLGRRGRRVVTDADVEPGAPASRGSGALLNVAFAVLVIAAAGATGYYIFKTGDSGAKMVWQGR